MTETPTPDNPPEPPPRPGGDYPLGPGIPQPSTNEPGVEILDTHGRT